MPVTPEQAQAAQAWFRSKVPDRCLVCSATGLQLADEVYTPYAIEPDGNIPLINARAFPCVAAVCSRCAYVMWFSAVAMGVHKPV